MSRKKVLVLGSNFGGLTAALAVKKELRGDVDVTVVSPSEHFLYNPSLIWLPFGGRNRWDITFPVEPTFERHDIEFVHAEANGIDAGGQKVETTKGVEAYDYLVVATGYRNDMTAVPGLGENSVTITTLPDALRAREAWKRFLESPGDVVVGATQGAGCFGAAYEFLFNTAYRLKKAGLRKQVRLHYVSSEPFLGHFGIGGLRGGEPLLKMFLRKEGIEAHMSVAMESVEQGLLRLADGTEIRNSFAMIVPPFLGQDFLTRADDMATPKGYLHVRDTYQSRDHDNVYAVGIAADVPVPWQTQVPTGLPKTGFPTERMAHVAATNIASQVRGEPPVKSQSFADMPAVCVMDAGNNGVMILADKMLPPRKAGALIPGPQNHALKVGLEKYFLWKNRRGLVSLP